MRVLKFGGTSVGSPEAMEKVFSIIHGKREQNIAVVVVVSAFKGVTDRLFEIALQASRGDRVYKNGLEEIEDLHVNTIRALFPASSQSDALTQFKITLNELEDVLQGVFLIRELTKKTLDFIVGFGERFSAQIIAAGLNNRKIQAVYTDTRQLIKTDENFGAAQVLTAPTYTNIKDYYSQHVESVIVATGFTSSTHKNESTTLGRGGSDYTASIFGAALGADAVEIWTDVDGLMTADPGKVKRAFPIDHLSYEEAMELSHFGAKVIYPPTIQPALQSGIPILIKNTFKPDSPGTQIKKHTDKQPGYIRGISSIDHVALITIKGSGMVGMSGMASRIFGSLAHRDINVILITQSSSEHSITLVVPPEQAAAARSSIEDELTHELETQSIDGVNVEENFSVIAVVGENMRNIPGIAGRVFNALGRNGVNIAAIAQGSSERNISFAVNRSDERKAINTLHDAFFLSGVKTVHLFVVGVGLIGGKLLAMLTDQARSLYDDYQIDINLKGVANSRRMLLNEEGIPLKDWRMELKENGVEMDLKRYVKEMRSMNLSNSIFLDCTASGEIQSYYEEILSGSISIVTPNKKANSSSQAFFDSLQEKSVRHNSAFRYETNVGAGLPLLGTMHEMVAYGDHVEKIEGVLSGTLSYIFNRFDGSRPFSEIVKEAQKKGYTEPDPREDLNGQDVGRKLLILARVAGYKLEFDDVNIESLVPEAARNVESIDEFFKVLKKYDKDFEKLRAGAEKEGKKLCYIARFEDGNPEVVLEKIDKDHAFYNLTGSDNIVSLYSKHYNLNPMVIQGPGAGANVTAGGIIADILRVTHTKAFNNAGT